MLGLKIQFNLEKKIYNTKFVAENNFTYPAQKMNKFNTQKDFKTKLDQPLNSVFGFIIMLYFIRLRRKIFCLKL